MNISILRDCSPSEVPNFGTDVPLLRTFLGFFCYRRCDGVESPEGLENAPAPKFIPDQNSTHPSSETTVSLFPDPIPDFFQDFRISIPSLTISLPINLPRARIEGSEPVVCWRRNRLGLAASSPSSTSCSSLVLGRSRGLQGESGTGSALESSEETWSYTFAAGWLDERRTRSPDLGPGLGWLAERVLDLTRAVASCHRHYQWRYM